MSTYLELKNVCNLKDAHFWIPDYQRGYRWDKQQVNELLDDLWEFWNDNEKEESYCLNPLVVIPRENANPECGSRWELVDGQQRLTTISIIMQVFGVEVPYTIAYETMEENNDKIRDVYSIDGNDSQEDINLHYMCRARECIENWKNEKRRESLEIEEGFRQNITKRVQFIWYATDEDDAVKIFTRLNAGRIALSGAELIKALFLNRRNFRESSSQTQMVTQVEMAKQWDEIETFLQNDEFWLFFNQMPPSQMGTRIDILLEVVVENDAILSSISKDKKKVGNDSYSTFRSYYELYKKIKPYKKDADDSIEFVDKWADVREVFDTLTEWYNDSELYHYTGYLMAMGKTFKYLYKDVWKTKAKDRRDFIRLLADDIKKEIKSCEEVLMKDGDLLQTKAKPLLLLHNIVTVVRQNQVLASNDNYQIGVFYKFPFHLFKIEKWDVEHIDSATPNSLDSLEDQKIWIKSVYDYYKHLIIDEELKGEIEQYLNSKDPQMDRQNKSQQDIFENLSVRLREFIPINDGSWKNKLKNYTLLDKGSNRSYKNAIFPVKRYYIEGKEKGKVTEICWDEKQLEFEKKEASFHSAFVVPCTKNVFQKTYTPLPENFTEWTEKDAFYYEEDLKENILYIDEIRKTGKIETPTQNK